MLIFLQEMMVKIVFQLHLSIVETFYIPINLRSTSSIHKGATEKKNVKNLERCAEV